MKRLKKCSVFIVATLLLLWSCQKEELKQDDANNSTTSTSLNSDGVNNLKATPYGTIWGIGPYETGTDYGRIYKWNGTTWTEPSPSARANQISVGANNSVWCLGALEPSGRRVFKWNGSSWTEPNPSARLYQIAAQDQNSAWGIGASYSIWRTGNGGLSYGKPSPNYGLKQISVGSSENIWGIDANNAIFVYNGAHEWIYQAGGYTQVSACSNDSTTNAWALYPSSSYSSICITKKFQFPWITPNPNVSCIKIAGIDTQHAWAIGASNRVFKTDNGYNWTEPNPSAQLVDISAHW